MSRIGEIGGQIVGPSITGPAGATGVQGTMGFPGLSGAAGAGINIQDVLVLPFGTPPTTPISGTVLVYANYLPPTNIIPVMTSATTPSGVASDQVHDSRWPFWCALQTGSGTGNGVGWLNGGGGCPVWIEYNFASAQTIISYSWVPFSNGGAAIARAPKDWQFQGYNGATWDVLDSRTGQIPALTTSVMSYTITSPASYTNYRMNITANGSGGYVGVDSFKMNAASTIIGLYAMDSDGSIHNLS